MLKKQAFSTTRADHQKINSKELPGHDNVAAAMPKVTYVVFAILHPLHSVEEDVIQTPETVVTLDDDKVIMTRVMFNDIMNKAIEDQKCMSAANSAEAVKVAYTEGVKKGCETQTCLHSSTMEHEVMCYPVEQSPIMPFTEIDCAQYIC